MVPKRAAELTDGGSLYWVIRGEVMCRQRIRDVRPFRDKDGIGRCGVVLDPKVVLVAPRPYRAFQGWRYLAGEGRAARPRQSGEGRRRHAGNVAARAARTRPDVSRTARPAASVAAWRCRSDHVKSAARPTAMRCGARQ